MPLTESELLAYLEGLGIRTSTTRHPPLFTVEQSKALRGTIPGAHTKNLFLRDRKDNFFLLTLEEEATVDLKTVHERIGASGRVSFGRPDQLMALLGVEPGAVTVFGAVNDREGRVRIFVDEALLEAGMVNAHPLTNEATTTIASADLARFLEATGHAITVLKRDG